MKESNVGNDTQQVEHQWIRTIELDGRWCELCGLAEARWGGDDCPREGAARVVEAKLVARLDAERQKVADLRASVQAVIDEHRRHHPQVDASTFYLAKIAEAIA